MLARRVGYVVAATVLVAACSAGPNDGSPPAAVPRGPHLVGTEQYRPSLEADVYLPRLEDQAAPVPVVVLVPGGAWRTADRAGLGPLAEAFASAGLAAVNATYRAADSGEHYPVPVQDVSCAAAFARDRVERAGLAAGPVLLLGHSSGAHLAALAALAPVDAGGCPYPAAAIRGLVGLAGPYDVSAVPDLATPLFGVAPTEDPDLWRVGNPLSWVDRRSSLPVLLAHGAQDRLVPVGFTTQFADALKAFGHPVQVQIVPGADHEAIYQPQTVAGLVVSWVRSTAMGTVVHQRRRPR